MKKWNGIAHKNSDRTDGVYCTCCGRQIVYGGVDLELNSHTGQYRNADMLAFPEDQSQGWFTFGRDCAHMIIEQQNADAPETAAECDRLRAINAELIAALERCLAHFERIRDQQADPHDSPMMAQARDAIARARMQS